MDYIKALRAMCNISKSFDKFMHKSTASAFGEFVENDCDVDDSFTFVFEGAEVTIYFTCGSTKACLINHDWPQVIKIGFADFKLNHAEREANVFSEAKRMNVDKFFVPCEKIGEIFGNPIFAMDLVDVDEYRITSDMWARCSNSLSNEEIVSILDEDCGFVEALFPFYYGDEVEELLDFISDLDINDLHSGNIGYDADGVIKLIDYSGYFPYFF